MKKYAFPFTLGLVCFVGGYVTCYGKLRERESRANPKEMSLRVARQSASGQPSVVIRIDPLASGQPLELKQWNQGLIAPMIPPKIVAP